MQKLQITSRGIKTSAAVREYIEKKMGKVSKVFNRHVYIHFEILKVQKKIGLVKSFEVEVTVHLPKAYLRVERSGENVYELIDEVEPVVKRLVNKYKQKMQRKNKKIKLAEAALLLS